MKHGGTVRLGVFVGALVSASAMMIIPVGAAENPYSAIIERNVFNLHPPPPPPNPADLVKKTPPPKILVTGINTILGRKVVFLTLPPLKPGGPPEYLSLSEGQAQDEIEVKSIDDKAGVVQIVNHGEPQPLDFEHDSPKPVGAPPGGTPTMPTPYAMPAPIPAAPPMPNAGSVVRPMRSLPARNSSAENNGGFGGGLGSGNFNPQQNATTLSPEEQVALIELQRIKALREGDPVSKILPPTPLTQEVLQGQQQPAPQ